MSVLPVDQLWRFALAAIPLALAVAAISRLLPCRPSTRHAMWVTVLAMLVIAPFLPRTPAERLVERIESITEPETPPTFRADQARSSADDVSTPIPDAAAASAPRPKPIPIPTPSPTPEPAPLPRPLPRMLADRPVTVDHGRITPGTATPSSLRRSPPSVASLPTRSPAPMWEQSTATAFDAPARQEPASQWFADARQTTRIWIIRLGEIRTTIMSLPPLPTLIWGAGSALLVVLIAARSIRFRRRLSRAVPADADVVRIVAECAADMGLANVPVTRMTDLRISPMVWCGFRPCLVLPEGLWDRLDDTGRRAVVAHELAHLRRHDHWVCWLTTIVGCLYWWHPVMWWLRRRIREEADLCCDMWVTTLMPTARRAYATALLETKKYTSDSVAPDLAIGLGVSTVRATRFSRRLTMVMSAPITPRLTIGSFILAATLATGAWLTAPALACPPEKTKKTPQARTTVTVTTRPAAPRRPTPPKAPAATIPGAPSAPDAPDTTFEQFMQERGDDAPTIPGLREKLERLEKMMDTLKGGDQSPQGLSRILRSKEATDLAGLLNMQYGNALTTANAHAMSLARAGQSGTSDCDTPVARTYQLSKCNLTTLTNLMVRSDVPIIVRPMDTALEVQATPAQHLIFEAFVKMIDGKEKKQVHTLPDGKREAMWDLMKNNSVPIMVRRKNGGIQVDGTDLEQAVFGAFVDMINGKSVTGQGHAATSTAAGFVTAAPRALGIGRSGSTVNVAAAPVDAHRRQLRELQAALRQLVERASEREHEAERLEIEAEHVNDQAERCEEQAERMEDSAADRGTVPLSVVERVNELLLQARHLENQSRYLIAQSEAARANAQRSEDEAKALEDRIDALRDRIAALRDERRARALSGQGRGGR